MSNKHVKSCSLAGNQGNAKQEHNEMLVLYSVYKRSDNTTLTTLENRNYHVSLDTS